MKKLAITSALAGSLYAATSVFAHSTGEYHMGPSMMWWGHGMGWWIFPGIMIFVLVMIFLFLGRRGGRSSWCGPDSETPMDVLKKRYARGEITKEEYESMKKDLTG